MFKKIGREARRIEQDVRPEAKKVVEQVKNAEKDARHGSQEIYQPEIAQQKTDAALIINQANEIAESIAAIYQEKSRIIDLLRATLSPANLEPITAVMQELSQLQADMNTQKGVVLEQANRILTTDDVMNDKNKALLGKEAISIYTPVLGLMQQALTTAKGDLSTRIDQAIKTATQAQQQQATSQEELIKKLQAQLAQAQSKEPAASKDNAPVPILHAAVTPASNTEQGQANPTSNATLVLKLSQ